MTQADRERNEETLDDRGTEPAEGREMLRRLRDAGFEGSDEKLAVALGRPLEEVAALTAGRETPDDDIIIKARQLATERNIEIEHDDLS
jgi:hypothetical protein